MEHSSAASSARLQDAALSGMRKGEPRYDAKDQESSFTAYGHQCADEPAVCGSIGRGHRHFN